MAGSYSIDAVRRPHCKGFPEVAGSLQVRDFGTYHGNWTLERQKDVEFSAGDPEVLILGAGQGGLEAAARLKHLGVTNLVVERNVRVGNNWRKRYEFLTLHDHVCKSLLLLLPIYYPYRPKVTKSNKTPPYLDSRGSWPAFFLRSIYPRVCRS